MIRNIFIIISLLLCANVLIFCQEEMKISIEQAVEIALKNDPSLRANELQRFQNEKLSEGSISKPATQVSFSGDEFNFDGNQGIQSLNFQQYFNHPEVAKGYNELYTQKAAKYERLGLLKEKEIVRHVESAYYRVVFAKQFVELSKELQLVYRDFYRLADQAFKSGETNKLPVLSASTLDKKSNLLVNHSMHEVEEAKEILNIWLGGNARYDVINMDIEFEPADLNVINETNPHLGIYEIQKSMALQQISIQKSLMLPQFIAGLSFQAINGDPLFFGYQVGVNVPLFRKSVNNKIEAAKINVDIQDEMKEGNRKKILLEVSRIANHIEHLVSKIEYFDAELLPAAAEEMDLMNEAYVAGEIKYSEFMITLENYKQFQVERLKLMEDYFMSRAELNYWTEFN